LHTKKPASRTTCFLFNVSFTPTTGVAVSFSEGNLRGEEMRRKRDNRCRVSFLNFTPFFFFRPAVWDTLLQELA